MKTSNPESYRTPENYFNDIITVLKHEMNTNIITELYKGATCMLDIRTDDNHSYTYFLTDNGGEFTIRRINTEVYYNIPYSVYCGVNHPIHIVEMIKQIMNNKKVEYKSHLTTDDMDYLLKVYKGL